MEKEKHRLSFHGDGGELFITYLVNGLLTIITVGIYRFWAKVRVRKFLYRYTEFMGERFDYHGTGKELFIGFLKALGFLIVYVLIIAGIFYAIINIFPDKEKAKYIAYGIIYGIIYLSIFAFVPFIITGMQRYRLSRSSWRNIRFKYIGTAKDLFRLYIKGVLLSILTLGFYSPWFRCRLYKFLIENSRYGNQPFKYSGEGFELFKIYLKGILLTIITLGVYGFWFSANIVRYYWNNISFQDNKFSSDITGGMIFKTTIKTIFLVIFSLGLGFPWALIWNIKMTLGSIGYDGDIDLAQIKADLDKDASSFADGLADATGAFDFTG
jgi:uncharacterized membrane protein YjgN (DUF898 family)